MKSGKRWLVLVLAAGLLGCGAGRDFKMPEPGALKLGVTTPGEAEAILGKPLSHSTERVSEVASTTAPQSVFTAVKQPGLYEADVYVFIDTSAQGIVGGFANKRPERFLRLVFWNDRLAGYLSWSSFKNDSTDFDESRVPQIQRGKSTEAEVLALMGEPSGGAIFPLISTHEGREIIYAYTEDDVHDGQRHIKNFAVYLDNAGVVRDMQSSDSTNPLPIAPSAPAPMVVPIIVHGH
jgi:hypothetical protein